MTRTTDGMEIQNAIVVTLDICSSSMLIEDLLKNDRSKLWRDLISNMKEYLTDLAPRYRADVHKFIGDGWIIFFHPPYSGQRLVEYLSNAHAYFTSLYEDKVFPSLDTPPVISGLTFGIDEGQLVHVRMQRRPEFVGRPSILLVDFKGN
jgi:hypothetical protein